MSDRSNGLVKIRVISTHDTVQEMAERIGKLLESSGYEVIEFSKSYVLQPPEEFRSRVFVAAIPKERKETMT